MKHIQFNNVVYKGTINYIPVTLEQTSLYFWVLYEPKLLRTV